MPGTEKTVVFMWKDGYQFTLVRNHSNEIQVSKLLAYKKSSVERRRLFEELKKKGIS